jgi:prepilin-type N-terminal cleavage/methylation domain-containing protein
MHRKAFTAAVPSPLPPGEPRGEATARGFSLVELLVVISIILVMMALAGAALSGARSSGAKQKTLAAITAIDEILQRHFANAESSDAAATGSGASRGTAIRRRLTADMPDSWAEVAHMLQQNEAAPEGKPKPFDSPRHRSYIATYKAINPTPAYSSAECLFMIVMQGGLADCLTCSTLDSAPIDDKDNDGAPEFLDAWGEPIEYVLWPAGFELPAGTKFFSQSAPFDGTPPTGTTGGTMRPLIVSGGPSKLPSIELHAGSYLTLGVTCGDPADGTIAKLGGLPEGSNDNRGDNLTNFDREVQR